MRNGTMSEWLERYRIEQLAAKYAQEGYLVDLHSEPYDLVVEKDGRKIAVMVKASGLGRADAKAWAERLQQLRQSAREQGLEFRAVIASPPQTTVVRLPGLDEQLLKAIGDHSSDALIELGSDPVVDGIDDLEIDVLDLSHEPYELQVHGTVGIVFDYGRRGREDERCYWQFPFTATVTLDPDHRVADILSFVIDFEYYLEAFAPADPSHATG